MIFKAIFLGIVQGVTEFLPVSSTGHLIVVEHWLGISQQTFGLTFDVALHLGTLAALVGYFWREIRELFSIKVVVATIPAVVLGMMLDPYIETTFRQPVLVAWALILFGLVIWWADRKGGKIREIRQQADTVGEIREIGAGEALVIGVFQALALFPGISRSGATISGGMFLGLGREASARFAFLLSIPIIFGAGAKRLWESQLILTDYSLGNLGFLGIAFLAASISSFFTIKYFLDYLKTARLWPFVVYRFLLGLIILKVFW